MDSFDFDLFVIGAGSGGVRAARMAADLGARVAVAEQGELGGTCVNVGCIPKKIYSYAAGYAGAFKEAPGYGWSTPTHLQLDWDRLKSGREREILRLNGVYDALLRKSGVSVLKGAARFANRRTIELNRKLYSARHVLVATGGRPFVPEIPGNQHLTTSDEMFSLAQFPRRLLVVGGGYIACELASIFHGLGAEVTQVHRGPLILSGFDDDLRAFITSEMRRSGIDLRLNLELSSISMAEHGFRAQLSDGSEIDVDRALCATGRVPSTRALGLKAADVKLNDRGGIAVDNRYQTSAPSVYAVGDVLGRVQLTPVAIAEAMVVVDQIFGSGRRTLNYEQIPTAVFTHPSIGTCGYTEQDARRTFAEVRVFSSTFKPLLHALSGQDERTFMKLIVDQATDRVVGLHMVGKDAAEIVQGFAVAMSAGATKAIFDKTIGIHPTVAEEFVTMREANPT